MSHIKLNNICKSYQGSGLAVSDFNLDIDGKEFIVFVGPSGCGKSTVLRLTTCIGHKLNYIFIKADA